MVAQNVQKNSACGGPIPSSGGSHSFPYFYGRFSKCIGFFELQEKWTFFFYMIHVEFHVEFRVEFSCRIEKAKKRSGPEGSPEGRGQESRGQGSSEEG